ncbi:unnamed protein product, partial [Protopolystoma xenopodis]
MAACKLDVPLPLHPAWYEMFNVDDESVREVAFMLIRLYARPKPDIFYLEEKLADLRRSRAEARELGQQAKQSLTYSSGQSTPNPTSTEAGSAAISPGNVELAPSNASNTLTSNPNLANAVATAMAVAANIVAAKSNSGLASSIVPSDPRPSVNPVKLASAFQQAALTNGKADPSAKEPDFISPGEASSSSGGGGDTKARLMTASAADSYRDNRSSKKSTYGLAKEAKREHGGSSSTHKRRRPSRSRSPAPLPYGEKVQRVKNSESSSHSRTVHSSSVADVERSRPNQDTNKSISSISRSGDVSPHSQCDDISLSSAIFDSSQLAFISRLR